MDGGDIARTPPHDQGATAPLLEFHQQHCSPSFAAAVAHDSPPCVQPLAALPPQPPRLGAGLGDRLNYQLGAQLGGQSSEDVPEQQSQDWPDGLLPAVPPRAAATAAHGRRLAQQQYPSLAQGTVPLPPYRSDEAVVLDHCLDAMQVLAERDVAAAASEATEQRVAVSEAARAGAVQVLYGSRCVGRFTSTPTEQQPRTAPEQDPSGVSGVIDHGWNEPPAPAPCAMH